jgi:hypothetical protein
MYTNLIGTIFHKLVKNTFISEKFLQICVKLEKLCSVGKAPAVL